MTDVIVKVEMDSAKLLRAHEARSKRVLYKQGAYIRKSMQRSMRYTNKADKKSAPGKPPLAHKDNPRGPLLRKLITFRVDEGDKSVIIGPPKDKGSNVPEVLDKGGRVQPRKLSVKEFEVGDYGPIRAKGGGRFHRVLLETPDMTARATRLVLQENEFRQSVGAYIKPRPFTAPVLTDGGENLRKLIEKERL